MAKAEKFSTHQPAGQFCMAMVDLCKGTIFDPLIEGHLKGPMVAVRRSTSSSHVFKSPNAEGHTLLVSIAFHALHYLDLRILLVLARYFREGASITLILRDHHLGPPGGLPFQEARVRLLELLELLDVPAKRIKVIDWSDMGPRVMNDPEFHAFLSRIDTRVLGKLVGDAARPFNDFSDVLTTLSDIFVASRRQYAHSDWLLGGPSRYAIHELGIEALGEDALHRPISIPLPPVPVLPVMPGLAIDDVPRARILEACLALDEDELLLLQHGFFELLEEALGEPLAERKAFLRAPEELTRTQLAALSADALNAAIQRLRRRAWTRRPPDLLRVSPAKMMDCLQALGDERRVRLIEVLLKAERGLTIDELRALTGLPSSKASTLRRDLATLRAAGLVHSKGLKPMRYLANGSRIEIRLPR